MMSSVDMESVESVVNAGASVKVLKAQNTGPDRTRTTESGIALSDSKLCSCM